MEHNLQVVVLPEHLLMPLNGFAGGRKVSCHYVLRDFSGQACGAADQSLVVFLDDLVAYPRLAVIQTLDVAQGHYVRKVLVALIVFREEDKVIVRPVLIVLEFRIVVSGDVHLAPDDRLDFVLLGLFVAVLVRELEEFLDTVHVAMIGDGKGGHAHCLGPVEEGCYR